MTRNVAQEQHVETTDAAALLKKREPLCEELAEHLEESPFGPIIKHPLLFSIPHCDEMNALMNFQLRHRKKFVQQALEDRDYDRYVIMHERPYRLEAAVRVSGDMDPARFYELLGEIWIDTENVYQLADIWETLLSDQDAVRQHMMTAEERETLAQMPDVVTVYRGTNRHGDPAGISWTTNLGTAEWFANRFWAPDSNPQVFSIDIPKDKITAYLERRGESEVILCPPPEVDDLTVVQLDQQ